MLFKRVRKGLKGFKKRVKDWVKNCLTADVSSYLIQAIWAAAERTWALRKGCHIMCTQCVHRSYHIFLWLHHAIALSWVEVVIIFIDKGHSAIVATAEHSRNDNPTVHSEHLLQPLMGAGRGLHPSSILRHGAGSLPKARSPLFKSWT